MSVLGILTSLAGLVAVVSSCDDTELNNCRRHITYNYDPQDPPVLTRQLLTKQCRDIDKYKSCVSTFRSNCPDYIRTALEGLEDISDYICGDGFESHLRHDACLSRFKEADLLLRCATASNSVFEDLNDKDRCKYYKNVIDCVKDAVDEECGSEAAEHQVKIEKKALQPIASLIDCDLYPVNWKLILGITFGVLGAIILAIVILCVCCCVRRKNKRRQDEENQNHQMNVITQPGAVPPNYPGPDMSPPSPPAYDSLDYKVPDSTGAGGGMGGGGGVDNPMYPSLPGKE